MLYFMLWIFFVAIVIKQLSPIIPYPGKLFSCQIEQQYSQCKRVCFEGIYTFFQCLGWHIKWTSNSKCLIHIGSPVRNKSCKPEIPQFPDTIPPKYISRLDIPMNHQFLSQILAGIDHLLTDFLPIYFTLRLEMILKSPSFTIVSDYIAVIASIIDIMKFYNVRMIQLLQNLYFVLKELIVAMRDISQSNNFDCI